jgi:hypothetical protein
MSDVDGKDLEINGIPVGSSVHRDLTQVAEYIEAYGFTILRTHEAHGAQKCWFCGKNEVWHKDYCEDCYRNWIWEPKYGLL